jgi:UDP-N-acetyl-D-galactosamine dehydrogenase
MNKNNFKIAIIGLGYVGLPLALEFQKKYLVLGFDTNKKRINELKCGLDNTLEVKRKDLQEATQLTFTNDTKKLRSANCYIVTVPTPVDADKRPNLKPLVEATAMIGSVLKKGDLVIYESTVYPG